jgi:hypothetical protein
VSIDAVPNADTPTFEPDDYVVTFGWRGFAIVLACLIVGAAIGAVLWVRSDSLIVRALVAVIVALLLAATARDIGRARRGEVLFAVHRGGVYFGSNEFHDDVPWSRICGVELYTERLPTGRSNTVHRCIAVRAPGVSAVLRAGNPVSARPLPRKSAKYYEDAGRRDLIEGADGTVRWTARTMTGWSVDRVRLRDAVRRYAPTIPVFDGPDWPPALSARESSAAARARRSRRR